MVIILILHYFAYYSDTRQRFKEENCFLQKMTTVDVDAALCSIYQTLRHI